MINEGKPLEVGAEVILIHYCEKIFNVTIEIPAVVTKIGHPTKIRVDTEHQKNILVLIQDIKTC